MPAFGPAARPTAAELDAVVGGPAGVPAQPRPPRRLGEHRALGSPGSRATPPTRSTAGIERDAAGAPDRHPARGRDGAGAAAVPATTDGEHDVGLLVAQTYLHSLGVTAWQDAILGTYAGNGDPASAYLRAVEAGELTARVRRCAVVGPRPRPRAGRGLVERRAAFTARPAPAGSGQDHAGRRRRELHRRDCPRRTSTATGTRPATPGYSFVDAGAAARGGRARWTPRASRCTCTRSATGRRARRSTRSRPPAARTAARAGRAPHRPPAGGPPRRRAAVRRARRDREHPGAVGLPRRRR